MVYQNTNYILHILVLPTTALNAAVHVHLGKKRKVKPIMAI